jgi:hypothetical protein
VKKDRLVEMFEVYEPNVQRVLREVLYLEQQYITEPLRTSSIALKEIREKIDEVIEETLKP